MQKDPQKPAATPQAHADARLMHADSTLAHANTRLAPADPTLTLDQRLDLLIDGELPHAARRQIIANLAQEPACLSRDIAVRFLEHQTERETVRQLIAGGRVVPVELVEKPSTPAPLARIGWDVVRLTMAVAAAVVVAVGIAMAYDYRHPVLGPEVAVQIPAEAVSYDKSVTLHVPVVRMKQSPDVFAPGDDPHVSKQSWVITPDGQGNATAVPVNTLKAAVE